MAGSNEIRQKIVLDGASDYKKSLQDAQRSLKTLRSELKAETAEMGRNATEAQKNEAKVKSLKKQIAEQEKIVKTYREALAEVKEKYGDNAEAVAKWEQKLNDARTSLANMKNELDGVGQGFKGMQQDANSAVVASKSVADSISNLSSVAEGISSSLEGIFTGMVSHIKDAVVQVWGIIADTAAKANNWTDLAGIYNSSTGKIQEWYNAFGATGGEGKFNDFVSFTSKLAAGGEKQWKLIAENFGISRENYEDDMQYAWDVIASIADYRAKNGQKAYEMAMTNAGLGKKEASVGWMISNWEGLNDNRQSFAESGYNMGEDSIDVFNSIQLKIYEINQKWDALKSKIMEPFAPIVLDIMTNVSGVMDGISEYFAAETEGEKEAALQKIRKNIEDLFTKLGELIRDCIHIISDVGLELQKSDDPLAKAIGDIMVKLAEALQWMVDNADKVKAAFETIFGVWLVAKLATVAGKLSSILMQIQTIKAFSAINGGGGAVATAGDGGTTVATAGSSGLLATLKSIWATGGGVDMLGPLGLLAAVYGGVELSNAQTAKDIDARTERRLAAAGTLTGTDAAWLEAMAAATGRLKDENGEYKKTAFGGTSLMSDYDAQSTLLMGLGDRGSLEKAKVLGALTGRFSGGNAATDELLEYWATGASGVDSTGKAWDPWRVTQLAETVADAYPNLPSADWWITQTKTDNALQETSEKTNSTLESLPGEVAKALGGVKVMMDKDEVGRLIAPVVNQQMASSVTY